mmetsp:Transcript_4461/g.9366  ORF Transcript_4461/g.9366 Transcript_4461/m.9366 type:complete len:355 (+) Transcript_4461:142-1206(+)
MRIASSVTNRIRNNREKRFAASDKNHEAATPKVQNNNNNSRKQLPPPPLDNHTLRTDSKASEASGNGGDVETVNSSPSTTPRHQKHRHPVIPPDDSTLSSHGGDPCLIQESGAAIRSRPKLGGRQGSNPSLTTPRNPRLERLERQQQRREERNAPQQQQQQQERENQQRQRQDPAAPPPPSPPGKQMKSPTFKRTKKLQPPQQHRQPQRYYSAAPPPPPRSMIDKYLTMRPDWSRAELAAHRKQAYELYRSSGKIPRPALLGMAVSLGVLDDPADVDLLPWTPDGRTVDREALREIVALEQEALEDATVSSLGTLTMPQQPGGGIRQVSSFTESSSGSPRSKQKPSSSKRFSLF